jgi:hypothetical protein
MSPTLSLPMQRVKAVFISEIEAIGGSITDTFEDDTQLFIRSTLPQMREVGPRDFVQAGVALRVSGPEIAICPYIIRLVCTNGAILAHILDSQHISQAPALTGSEIEVALRRSVQACSSDTLFLSVADQIRLGRETEVDPVLSLLPHLAELPQDAAAQLLEMVFNQWLKSSERSRFGLMNAVTALARDTSDPEGRWRLEELGGRIAIPVSTVASTARSSRTYAQMSERQVRV